MLENYEQRVAKKSGILKKLGISEILNKTKNFE